MTTPTTMTTSMITTVTTMMADVVVVPSLEGLLVGCMSLIETVPVVVTAPTVWGKVVCSGINAVETQGTKHKMCYVYSVRKQEKTL